MSEATGIAGAAPIIPSSNTTPIEVSGNQPAPAAPPPSDWVASLPENLRGYAQLKQFKDPSAVVDAYQNLEKLHGVPRERLLKLPEKPDAPEWNDVYGKLGRPEKADDYKIDIPKEHGDENFAKWAKGAFHELGLSKTQAEKLAGKWNEYMTNGAQQSKQQMAMQGEQQLKALEQEWGAAYDTKLTEAYVAMEKLGVVDAIAAIPDAAARAKAFRAFAEVGSKLGEAEFHTGGKNSSFGNVLTPAAARAKIAQLGNDQEFTTKYLNGDMKAVEEFTNLHKWANS
ncbi:hypothetical protein E6Q11_02600 [Candidatus Dojkabacteria bacterium]|uniref:Uncharacterized protein n=1 Tax=Candidatus Dojkabacteria bacterium TaxID=2099670 RepID=A0A5C7J803_9BACT|nr:MAG: hypothetical protein E6Q11_02600 [Candidatus Dojkabacteria bacterium]